MFLSVFLTLSCFIPDNMKSVNFIVTLANHKDLITAMLCGLLILSLVVTTPKTPENTSGNPRFYRFIKFHLHLLPVLLAFVLLANFRVNVNGLEFIDPIVSIGYALMSVFALILLLAYGYFCLLLIILECRPIKHNWSKRSSEAYKGS